MFSNQFKFIKIPVLLNNNSVAFYFTSEIVLYDVECQVQSRNTPKRKVKMHHLVT